MEQVSIREATCYEDYAQMSKIHAEGWRKAYVDAIPNDFMEREITDDRWIPFFQGTFSTGVNHGLLVYDGDKPVCCACYGPARIEAGPQSGTVCKFQSKEYAGWGEIISFYTLPEQTGKGYGSLLMEEVLHRLKQDGFTKCFLYVLRENEGARRFYERYGFTWNGTYEEIPFPPDTVCIDLRYTRDL